MLRLAEVEEAIDVIKNKADPKYRKKNSFSTKYYGNMAS
jgi:hypothetical protein